MKIIKNGRVTVRVEVSYLQTNGCYCKILANRQFALKCSDLNKNMSSDHKMIMKYTKIHADASELLSLESVLMLKGKIISCGKN